MAYGIKALIDAMHSNPMAQSMAARGRGGDSMIGHLTPGEMVVPRSVQTPGIMALLSKEMRARGMNPSRFQAGSNFAQRNPLTGAQEFQEWPAMDEDPYAGWAPDPFTGQELEDYYSTYGPESEEAAALAPVKVAEGLAQAGRTITPTIKPIPAELGARESEGPYEPSFLGRLAEAWGAFKRTEPTSGLFRGEFTPTNIAGAVVERLPGIGALWAINRTMGELMEGKPYAESEYAARAERGDEEESEAQEGTAAKAKTSAEEVMALKNKAQQALAASLIFQRPQIDYQNYAYGPEQYMYPWVLPGGQTSYGRYPMYSFLE